MQNEHVLKNKLKAIDGKDYGSCQSLKGGYQFGDMFTLRIVRIPKDPYAPPHTGIYTIQVRRNDDRIISAQIDSKIREVAFRDFIARRFYEISSDVAAPRRGTGFSGAIAINEPGQVILDRNCVVVDEDVIEIRCFIGIPAKGRHINAALAEVMLFEELPEIVEQSLFREHIDEDELQQFLDVAEDADYLRNQLSARGLIGFIADDSILPRASGTSEKPMERDNAVAFKSVESIRVSIDLPHRGAVSGMGIKEGVTLIVGGGYHGKSTLLQTLEQGCYNHIPGDGREYCVSLTDTVKVRAYSGRSVYETDISSFIKNIPFKKDTTAFSTKNASGSTSQAANIIEAVEVGAKVLLMDEDTCAANFMIRDKKMQQLVAKNDEPITPFIDKVRQLYDERDISTVLVLGGVGDYFDVSDTVIQMQKYEPVDVTKKAKEIAKRFNEQRIVETERTAFLVTSRMPLPNSISSYSKYGKVRIFAKELRRLNFGEDIIDLTDCEQLIELSQTKAIGYALQYTKKYMDGKTTIEEIVDKLVHDIEEYGLDILSDRISGHFAAFRKFEFAAALNRLKDLNVKQRM